MANLGSTRTRKLIVVVSVLMVGFLTITLATRLSTKSVNDAFLSAVVKNDSKKSYNLTSTGFRFSEPPDKWENLVKQVSSAYKGQPKKISEKANPIADNPNVMAQYVYEIAGTGGPYKITIYLVKEDNRLKVSSFDSVSKQK